MLAVCRIITLVWYDNCERPKTGGRKTRKIITMPRYLGHERSEVRTYTFLRNVVRQRLRLCTPAGLSRPRTHDKGRRPLTLPNPARIGCALRSLAPETQRQGALLPRHSQRQGFRAPAPTASVSPLDQDPVSPRRPGGKAA
jgi:hypothetical protein